jgi:2-polyprenyl-3-methyl-5-hydroxy-6-metoxy-1,4-benzoquinol methylase
MHPHPPAFNLDQLRRQWLNTGLFLCIFSRCCFNLGRLAAKSHRQRYRSKNIKHAMKQKLKYLFTCIRKHISREGFSCPSCGCAESRVVARKYLVTELRRCEDCQLLFRTPTTTSEENASFYQEEYTQGFTTDCPSDDLLSKYLESEFSGGEKDYSDYIDVVLAAGGKTGDRLFDFGCSWGYGSWQFLRKGFEVESFEISVPRANFAKSKLGIEVHSSLSDVKGPFDIFFSAHVLEHVPSVKDSIELGMDLLKPKGLFVAFTPNGSEEYRKSNVQLWNKLWGLVHPNFLDSKYYEKIFAGKSPMISSNPYVLEEIEEWRTNGRFDRSKVKLSGPELLVLVKK